MTAGGGETGCSASVQNTPLITRRLPMDTPADLVVTGTTVHTNS
jgi:hypothetical protein